MNKPDFLVVVPCHLITEKELDISLRAFLRFFQSVTHRHQRRSRFLSIGASTAQREIIQFFWKKTALPSENLLFLADRAEAAEFVTASESLLLLPTQRLGDSIRVETIQWSQPVLTFENWEKARSFDAGFCIFIDQNLEDQAVKEFGSLVRMLYFDSGAMALLRQKARGLRRPSSVFEKV